jgi:uncharacterized protein (TIGR01244 family)
MEPRHITENYAVSPQIHPEDVARIREAGFVALVCNRPDAEVPHTHRADTIRALADAEGLVFIANPLTPGQLTMEIIETQGRALQDAPGKVFAYCASGNRSSILWALSQAGKMPTEEMIAAAARWGYDLEKWRDHIESLAARAQDEDQAPRQPR